MSTRTITGNIKDLTDSAVASGTVTFEKLVTSTTGNTIHQSGVDTATTNGSGDFSIDLAVPASGSYRYRMILPNGWSFYFSIAAGASVNVATLIIAETIEDSDAIVEALAAYVPLSGGTMTGQLNFSGTTHAGVKLLSLTTAQRDALTPANGMVIYNSTTATGQVYQGGTWASVGGGASAWGSITGTLANQTDLQTELTTLTDNINTVTNDLETHVENTTNVHGIADTSALLDTGDLGVSVQGYSAKTAAIAALTWAANSIILLTGTATASVQALAAHVVTFLQSANVAAARAAIEALPEDAGIVTVSSGRDLATTDAGKMLECSGTFSITCPNGLDAGFQCTLVNVGAGTITIAAATTLQGDGTQLATQYTGATVYHRGSNIWLAMGRLT